MSKPVLVISSSNSTAKQIKCEECGTKAVIGANDSFCPKCSADVESSTDVRISASSAKPALVCSNCETELYVSTISASDAVNNCYCPVCGSEQLEEIGEETENMEENLNLEPTDVEEEAEEKLASSSTEELEAAFISNPKQWVFFKSGVPYFTIEESKISPESHAIFSSDAFTHIFAQRVQETSLGKAIKEFNGKFLTTANVPIEDIEALASDKFKSTHLPELLKCVAMAIEGATKGVFPEINQELKAAFYEELVARGMLPNRAYEAIEASFSSSAKQFFSAVIAKAMELFHKPENIRQEIKAMIQSSGTISGTAYTPEDFEQMEVQNRLKASFVPVMSNAVNSESVKTLRDQITLGGRRNA